ncbi:MAG: hypothetical protein ACOZAK_01205 [Patescibacteria group bacterium]
MAETKPDRTAVFTAIDSTRPILGENWRQYWLKVLKPEVITAYLLYKGEADEPVTGEN